MEMLHNSISWFEIPVANFDRAKKFYSAIYDFDMPEMQMGPNRMGFFLYEMEKGGIGGAIVQGDGYVPSANGARVYLGGGSDLNAVLDRVEKAGGKVILQKTLVAPGMGFYGTFEDSEGNRVSLHSMS